MGSSWILLLKVMRKLYALRVRGLGRLIASLARGVPSLQNAPVPMNDGRVLYLDLREPWCVAYLLLGEIPFEHGETQFVRSLVRQGEVAVDGGAFIGWYTTLLAELVGSSGRVYAFEPNVDMCKLLSKTAAKYPHVEVVCAALGERAGSETLYVPVESNKASVVPPRRSQEAMRFVRCQVISLDEFLGVRRVNRVAFVKLDVEGSELRVLKGAKDLLSNS